MFNAYMYTTFENGTPKDKQYKAQLVTDYKLQFGGKYGFSSE
jgi:hypothetical protein